MNENQYLEELNALRTAYRRGDFSREAYLIKRSILQQAFINARTREAGRSELFAE